jgi:cobalt-zinc-cadmium efflux system membrane fusion protein
MKVNAWIGAAGVCLVFAAGAGTTYLWTDRSPRSQPAATGGAPTATGTGIATPESSDVITIAPELMQRAGILSEAVAGNGQDSPLRVPGSVEPNAYRKVSVTPLVGGRVSRVLVELGQAVARGALLAEVYSPEVAQARAAHLAATADAEAGEARLHRTERLVALGSASQQELDEVRAEHIRHETAGREAAARLRLFGLDPSRVTGSDHQADTAASVIRVTAPQAGVVIERPVTVGMTVEAATPLVTIAELSPVWVIADVYERDLARVSTGRAASITTEAHPDLQLTGRITYVAPVVRQETRTTQVRVEVPNPDGGLRFGMYVTVNLGGQASDVLTIPKAAVQTIGPDTIVFVPEGSSGNAFKERRVTVGQSSGDRVALVAGLTSGERVVTQGSFTLRAEAERLGIRPVDKSGANDRRPNPDVQIVSVEVTEKGFNVSVPAVKAGIPVRMTFTRKTNATCATDLAIPEHGIKRELPLNTPVTVEFTPRRDVTYQCGMGMLSGTLTVR